MAHDVTRITADYYDSEDANTFYFELWGGEDIHVGIYDREDEPIFDASRRTVASMMKLLPPCSKETRVLDMGAGFGGSARFLAGEFGCHVECLNLSAEQNKINERLSAEKHLANQISVQQGNFESLPYGDGWFDVCWSQDAFLHSGKREVVLREAYRTLKPGGTLIFTDPMQDEDADPQVLQPVLDRIHLASLSTVSFYRRAAQNVGFEDYYFQDLTPHLTRHYARVLAELESCEQDVRKRFSADYTARMEKGLRHWVKAGETKNLRWGIFRMRKPA